MDNCNGDDEAPRRRKIGKSQQGASSLRRTRARFAGEARLATRKRSRHSGNIPNSPQQLLPHGRVALTSNCSPHSPERIGGKLCDRAHFIVIEEGERSLFRRVRRLLLASLPQSSRPVASRPGRYRHSALSKPNRLRPRGSPRRARYPSSRSFDNDS